MAAFDSFCHGTGNFCISVLDQIQISIHSFSNHVMLCVQYSWLVFTSDTQYPGALGSSKNSDIFLEKINFFLCLCTKHVCLSLSILSHNMCPPSIFCIHHFPSESLIYCLISDLYPLFLILNLCIPELCHSLWTVTMLLC